MALYHTKPVELDKSLALIEQLLGKFAMELPTKHITPSLALTDTVPTKRISAKMG